MYSPPLPSVKIGKGEGGEGGSAHRLLGGCFGLGGLHPTSDICIILQIILKPNPIVVFLIHPKYLIP